MTPRDWIDRIYRDTPGHLVVNYQPASGAFVGTGGWCESRDQAAERVTKLDRAGAKGVYLRATTVGRRLDRHERGTAEDSAALPGLWADVDLGTTGHAHDPAKHDGRTLPPDEAAAAELLAATGLPEPSLLVHSGGGIYPWWLLDQPAEVNAHTLPVLAALSAGWQEVIGQTAARLGWFYGTGVGDLARVLRVPGTTNRKAGQERPCRLLSDTGRVYALRDLLNAHTAAQEAHKATQAPPTPAAAPVLRGAPSPFDALEPSPLDRFDRDTSWGDLLGRHGWQPCGQRHGRNIAECFRRPGDPESPCSAHVLADQPAVLVVWSESAGLPTGAGRRLTKARVAAHLEHGGDVSALARSLVERDRGNVAAPRPTSTPAPATTAVPASHESADDATEAALQAAAALATEVEREAFRIRVREAARAKVDAEKAAAEEVPPFDAGLLSEVLARPAEPPHRAEGLIPSEAGTLIVAQRKTGKTTLELNLARSLILGGDFLGRFPVRPVTGRVGLLNFEVSAAQLALWADEVGVPADRLYLVNLRGRRNPFGLDGDREALAEELCRHEVESLIVDPFGRAYTGKSQNDPGEVGAWLSELDRFARGEAGVSDVILTAHAGWDGERTRGSSALEDWADVIVTLVRDRDDDQERYLRAEGRDVLVEEDRLNFDGRTRTLTLAGAGSRKTAAKTRHVEDLIPAVLDIVKGSPGITGYKVAQALREGGHPHQKGDHTKALAAAVERGLLRFEDGTRNAKNYFTTTTYPDLPRPTPTGVGPHLPPPPFIGVGEVGQVGEALDVPQAHSGETDTPAPADQPDPADPGALFGHAGTPAKVCDTCDRLVPVDGPDTCDRCDRVEPPPRPSYFAGLEGRACRRCGVVPGDRAGLGVGGLCVRCEITVRSEVSA